MYSSIPGLAVPGRLIPGSPGLEWTSNSPLELGGMATAYVGYGGSQSVLASYSGIALNPLSLSGSTTVPVTLNGAESQANTMAMMTNLTAYQGNDTPFPLQVTLGAYPLNITGYTPKIVIKANSLATDASGTTYLTGSGLTVTSTKLGQLTFTLPHSAATTAGTFWWRLDVTDGSGNVTTSMYGNLYILAV
jgi:hypothetical protein